MRHTQLDGNLRRGNLTALCGAVIALHPAHRGPRAPPEHAFLLHTDNDGEPCPRCVAREAAKRLGADFVACGACEGTGSVARVDSPATACMNCGGEGVYQWQLRDGQR